MQQSRQAGLVEFHGIRRFIDAAAGNYPKPTQNRERYASGAGRYDALLCGVQEGASGDLSGNGDNADTIMMLTRLFVEIRWDSVPIDADGLR